jgi:hypothetical protein
VTAHNSTDHNEPTIELETFPMLLKKYSDFGGGKKII